MALYKSKIATVNKPFNEIYGKVSDLKNLEQFRDRLPQEHSEGFECDTDYVQFKVAPIGEVALRIVERNDDSIRLKVEKLPFKADMLLNIGNISQSATEIQLVLDADLPFFVKPMVDSKLGEGMDKMVDMLAVGLNGL